LLFADRLINPKNVSSALLISGLIMALRWLLYGLVQIPWFFIVSSVLHGGSMIVFGYSVLVYINATMMPELKASAQGFAALLVSGFSRPISALTGGFLNDAFGADKVFISYAVINVIVVAVFYFVFKRQHAQIDREKGA